MDGARVVRGGKENTAFFETTFALKETKFCEKVTLPTIIMQKNKILRFCFIKTGGLL